MMDFGLSYYPPTTTVMITSPVNASFPGLNYNIQVLDLIIKMNRCKELELFYHIIIITRHINL